MTVFGKSVSWSYHRRAADLLRGVYRNIAADLAIAPGSVVVYVGTGPRLLLHHLADRDLDLHGVDPSPDMVATLPTTQGWPSA